MQVGSKSLSAEQKTKHGERPVRSMDDYAYFNQNVTSERQLSEIVITSQVTFLFNTIPNC